MAYKKILVATDLLEGSSELLRKASKLAKEQKAKLSVIHVVEPLPGYGYAFVSPIEIEDQLVDEAKKQLKKMAKRYDILQKDIHVEFGPTKVEILDLAEQKKMDLIIVGTHNRHDLGHLLGSTANAVVHSAHCDVLTLRLK